MESSNDKTEVRNEEEGGSGRGRGGGGGDNSREETETRNEGEGKEGGGGGVTSNEEMETSCEGDIRTTSRSSSCGKEFLHMVSSILLSDPQSLNPSINLLVQPFNCPSICPPVQTFVCFVVKLPAK